MMRIASLFIVFLLIGSLISGCGTHTSPDSISSDPDQESRPSRRTVKSEDNEVPRPPSAETERDQHLRLGRAALEQSDLTSALQHFLAVPLDGSRASEDAWLTSADIYESQGRLHDAIETLEKTSQAAAQKFNAAARLIDLYAMTGQRIQAERLLVRFAEPGRLSYEHLVLLTDFDRRHPRYADILHEIEQTMPGDPAVSLGLAVEEMHLRQLEKARERLEEVIRSEPNLATAQGLLGEILADLAPDRFSAWFEQLPADLRTSPEICFACGRWCQATGQPEMAARCYWESARTSPTSHRIARQLAAALTEAGADEADEYRRYAEALFGLRQNLSNFVNGGGRDLTAFQQVVTDLLNAGRRKEAECWLVLAQSRHRSDRWIRETLTNLQKHGDRHLVRIGSERDLIERKPLDRFPRFALVDRSSAAESDARPEAARRSIRFEEQAAALGVDFRFQFGRPTNTRDVRMFESTGGGIGVLDVDVDGRPDLYLTQGQTWSAGAAGPDASPEYSDALFRNLGERFAEIAEVAGIRPEVAYSQGCAAGDVDNDGFADLYVASIGVNRLLLNNGDGTFTDVSETAGIVHHAWTTSCVIADIDGDSHPDLFDVNYLEGNRVFHDTCNQHQCSTAPFDGAPDMVSWSDGTLRFRQVRRHDEGNTGPGLGVVVCGDFHGSERPDVPGQEVNSAENSRLDTVAAAATGSAQHRQLCLFVANDGKPDFLLRSETDSNGEFPGQRRLLSDWGVTSGLAVNADGRATASMGIAAGDINSDGRLDLLVTNYSGESNSLFVQQSDGYFVDHIAGTRLMQPGLPWVAWGTQFLDADCDGKLDLFIANGHVANFQDGGGPYEMPQHVFQQQTNHQFEMLTAAELGPYFEHPLLGRAAVRWDWNQDGRPDIVHGTLSAPYAVLTNVTENDGHFVAVRLHAVHSARDAIGTRVTVTCDDRQLQAELTAGDGFQVSQERVLHFGLGSPISGRCQIRIDWTSGFSESFSDVPLDVELEVTEGHPGAPLLRRQGFVTTHPSNEPANR